MNKSIAISIIVVCALLGSMAQLFWKQAVDPLDIKRLILGALLYGFAMVLYLVALRSLPLHIGYSIIALSYVFVMILSWQILDENVTLLKLLGSIIIVIGVFIIAK